MMPINFIFFIVFSADLRVRLTQYISTLFEISAYTYSGYILAEIRVYTSGMVNI